MSPGSQEVAGSMSAGARTEAGSGEKFRDFLARDWQAWIQAYPEAGTVLGMPGMNDRWTDDSEEGIARRTHHLAQSVTELGAFDREKLPPADRLSFDLYHSLLTEATKGRQYGLDPFPFVTGSPRSLWMPLNQLEGIPVVAGDMVELQPRSTRSDYDDLLARLKALP